MYQIVKVLVMMLISLSITAYVFLSFQEGINNATPATQALPTRLTLKTGDDVEYNGWWVCYEGRQLQLGSVYNYHIRILSRSSSIRWYDLTFTISSEWEVIHFIGTDFKVISKSDAMLVLEAT
jgi:hypothetical protein